MLLSFSDLTFDAAACVIYTYVSNNYCRLKATSKITSNKHVQNA